MRLTILALMLFAGVSGLMANDTTQSKSLGRLPSVTVKKLDGTPINIQEFGKTGKITVISFWATWCAPCIKELEAINELYEDWQKQYGIELVAVSIDDARTAAKVQGAVNNYGWPYTILCDENKDLARAMNVNNPPQTILIDQNGNIVYIHNGYTSGTELELEAEIKKLLTK